MVADFIIGLQLLLLRRRRLEAYDVNHLRLALTSRGPAVRVSNRVTFACTVQRPIEVPVRDDFRLVVGTLREEDGGAGITRIVEPPAVDLFSQVIDFLEARPEATLPRFSTYDEALATVAVCLRWGSYFALPADRSRPLWREARNPRVSLIADPEMKRINIEACCALERWLEIWRTDRDRWYALVARAVRYLPMETRSVKRGIRHRAWPLSRTRRSPG